MLISRVAAAIKSAKVRHNLFGPRRNGPRKVDLHQRDRSLEEQVEAGAEETALVTCISEKATGRTIMNPRKRFSIKSMTVSGLAASALLGLAGVTLNPAPAAAVVYCQYVDYPVGCVARSGVVLRPRPVARAAVRHNVGGNANGGVNRVGARR